MNCGCYCQPPAAMRVKVLLFLFVSWLLQASAQTPEFLSSQSQVSAVRGSTAVIPCRIRNRGNYRVLWSFERVLLTFEEKRITDDSRISVERPYESEWNLHIRNVKREDAGVYLCQLNTMPMMSQNIRLLVTDEAPPPVVPRDVAALAGSDVEIACKLPDLNDVATWSYTADEQGDRQIIRDSQKFDLRSGRGQDSHVHTLVISDVTAGDAGNYFCRARSGTEAKSSLRIIAPPPPPSLEVKAQSANQLMVRWRRPTGPDLDVAGYTLYVLDRDTGKEDVFQVPTKTGMGGQESFRVANLSTQTSYTVQLATKLRLGESLSLGKRSPEVRIATPLFVPDPPGWVKVQRLSDEAAEVQWSAPLASQSNGIVRGYTVMYTPLTKDKRPITSRQQTLRVTAGRGTEKRVKARLTGLRPKTRYHVRVAGFTRKGNGRFSKTVTYLHKTLPPELSLNGRVLSDNSVLLTVTSMGSARMTNVKMFYTEAAQPSWKRLNFSPEWKFTVVGGLDPRTSYFFKVKAKIGGKLKQCVTHITTPPHDLQAPQDVQVSATASTSIEVTWAYDRADNSSSLPLGYIVHLQETSENGVEEKHHRQSVVFNRTSVEVKDLSPGMRYNIQVVAFNGFGEGPRTDGLLFHIAESDVKLEAVNEPFPPRFTHDLPGRLTIQSGETVRITCAAEGYPVPEVRWYEGEEPIGVSAQGSNQLYLTNVVTSTLLTCRATSQMGQIQRSTIVDVMQDRQEEDSTQQPLTLSLQATNVLSSTLTLAWNLLAGQAQDIGRFQIEILDDLDRVLLSDTLPGQTRSFNLRGLQPGTEYRAVLRAFPAGPVSKSDVPLAQVNTTAVTLTADGGQSATQAAPPAPTPTQDQARYRANIDLSLMDVTPTSAMVSWDFGGLDPRYVQMYDVKVKSGTNLTLVTKQLGRDTNALRINLQAGEVYYVQVRAFDRRGEVLALNTIRLTTPADSFTDTGLGDTQTAENLSGNSTRLSMTPNAVSGQSARLDWTLSGPRLPDVSHFVLAVKDRDNRTLLRQEMTSEARSLTLSNLTPRTTYVVHIQAMDSNTAVVAASSTTLTTTADEEDETSTVLRVFTEELNTESVKVAWTTPARLLATLTSVTVRLSDIANNTLLTQTMSPLTRSLTVRNLQPGEHYQAFVQLIGPSGQTLRSGRLEFDTDPTTGLPGRPVQLRAQALNSTAVRLQWRNTRSLAPAAGADSLTGYIVRFVTVDSEDQATGTPYQIPVFGGQPLVVVPNLRPSQRYSFQVAARNQYSFGPLSSPVSALLPRQ